MKAKVHKNEFSKLSIREDYEKKREESTKKHSYSKIWGAGHQSTGYPTSK